ncbi:MAG: hypothetical protein RL095_662 [Verrucomicrobiota bacterium]|jgi:hypothetical protein
MNPHYALHTLSLAVIGCLIWKWPAPVAAPAAAKSAEKPALPGAQKGDGKSEAQKLAANAKTAKPGKAVATMSEVERIIQENQGGHEYRDGMIEYCNRIGQRSQILRHKFLGLSSEDSERLKRLEAARDALCMRGGWIESTGLMGPSDELTDAVLEKMSPEERVLAEQIQTLDKESKSILERYPEVEQNLSMISYAFMSLSDEDYTQATDVLTDFHKSTETLKTQLKNADATSLEKLKGQWNADLERTQKRIAAMPSSKRSFREYLKEGQEQDMMQYFWSKLTPNEFKNDPTQESSTVVDLSEPEVAQP